MRLLLVRHAKAFERDPAAWPDDLRRPLTTEGREEFRAAAKRLRRIQRGVDLVMASPAVRAWQTAQLLSETAGWPAPERCEWLLPQGEAPSGSERVEKQVLAEDTTEWTRLLAGYGDEVTVVWVGHEPMLGRIASWLLTADPGRANIRFKKGAAVAFDRERGMSALAWMVTPKLLRDV